MCPYSVGKRPSNALYFSWVLPGLCHETGIIRLILELLGDVYLVWVTSSDFSGCMLFPEAEVLLQSTGSP